jgi:hypothetical protein
MRVAKGELLKDVSHHELVPEYRAELAADALYIHGRTNITVRRVIPSPAKEDLNGSAVESVVAPENSLRINGWKSKR